MKKITYLIIFVLQFTINAWSQQSFIVQKIDIRGLRYINPVTVESYLPIKRGQNLPSRKTSAILKALYKTGFFDRISLSREGNTLIIYLTERPTIGSLKITGNSIIPTDKLTAVLKTMDIAEGRVYNPSVIERIKKSLLSQYYQLGHYNARVTIQTSAMSRNRLSVGIDISEGVTAKVRRIIIIGNRAFSEKALIKQLDLTTSGLTTFFTQTDRYSEDKLELSLEKLRNFYLDNGYLRFAIKSSQTAVTPNRKGVYVTIVIDEGNPYLVKDFNIEGELALSKEEIMKQVTIQRGETFSRQKVIDSEKAITKLLGDAGYMFATINLVPKVDDERREISLYFHVTSGKRAYVRHINFSENRRTNDVVLRREIEQMESAPVSTSKLEESVHRLKLLPFIKEVNMSINRVPEAQDQIDVNYKVKEDNSAQATFKLGYSSQQGLILGASLNQKNFFGTGDTFSINLQRSRYEQNYGMDFTDPYYTPDGISRSLSFSVSRVNPGQVYGLNSDYTTNEYDLGVIFGIPVGQETGAYNRIIAGVIYQNTLIKLTGNLSNQVNDFVTRHGRHFQELDLRLGYSRNTYDRAIFPTKGTLQSLFLDGFAPLAPKSLSFYIFNYHGKWYRPITDQFIILGKANLGYGNGLNGVHDFPFFRNFFAGGIDSVRGYSAYTLGPRDSTGGANSNGKAFGGNMLIDGSIGLIFPNPISDNLRTSVFFDAGNVYSSLNNRNYGGSSTNSGPLRYSAGIEADWLTPFGPIALSLAKAINARPGDDTDPFQFALGANF